MAFGGGPKEGGGGGGPLLDADIYPAKISGIWYIGECDDPWDEAKPPKPMVAVNFTFEERYDIPEDKDKGRAAYTGHKNMAKNYPFFSNENSNWYALYKAVLGRPATKEELEDPSILFGKSVMVSIQLGDKKGNSYIHSLMHKKALVAKVDKDSIGFVPSIYDITEHTVESFLKLPERGLVRLQAALSHNFSQKMWEELPQDAKDGILRVDEKQGNVPKKFSGAAAGGGEGAAFDDGQAPADFDDDIPF